MRRTTVRAVLGGVLLVMGVVWLLQGLGVLAGSTMTGSRFWAWIGGVCLVAAAFLFGSLARRRP